jgi:type II secretory pathway pseudopilin PulG
MKKNSVLKSKRLSHFSFPISHSQKGFTYIELILYISLITMVIMALVPFAWNVIGGSVKSRNQQEVSAQARAIGERIKWEIRNAKDVQAVTSTQLTLNDFDSTKNPTIIKLNGTNITIKEGTGAEVPLHSDTIQVTSLTFSDYTSTDDKTKNVQFTFTVDERPTGTRHEYQVPSVTVEGDAEVRSN